jgi:hypothetical protein
MQTPIVTELPLALEPVTPDEFAMVGLGERQPRPYQEHRIDEARRDVARLSVIKRDRL